MDVTIEYNRVVIRKHTLVTISRQQALAENELVVIRQHLSNTDRDLSLTSLSQNGFLGGRFIMSDSAASYASAIAGT